MPKESIRYRYNNGTMNEEDTRQLWADVEAPICCIPIQEAFSTLSETEQLYAHFSARAAFLGTRILLSQTSAESESIFDLIMELYAQIHSDWADLAADTGVNAEDLSYFIDYAAMFLSNIGNYRVSWLSSA